MHRVFFLLLKHIYEFQDITGTGTSVSLSLGFHSIQLTVTMAYECNVPMAYECNLKKKKPLF